MLSLLWTNLWKNCLSWGVFQPQAVCILNIRWCHISNNWRNITDNMTDLDWLVVLKDMRTDKCRSMCLRRKLSLQKITSWFPENNHLYSHRYDCFYICAYRINFEKFSIIAELNFCFSWKMTFLCVYWSLSSRPHDCINDSTLTRLHSTIRNLYHVHFPVQPIFLPKSRLFLSMQTAQNSVRLLSLRK